MGDKFFGTKKRWSKYKDFILDYYLKPYISKVRRLGKPIAIIDCCAGPGKFKLDNEDGSPLIICRHLKEWRDKENLNIIGIFIEKNNSNYEELKNNLIPYKDYTYAIKDEFRDYIDRIKQLTSEFTIFLYVDPFGVKDLVFADLEKIFNKISNNNSVELLLNFDCDGFLRWGGKCTQSKNRDR